MILGGKKTEKIVFESVASFGWELRTIYDKAEPSSSSR